ncbi:hypothetical protein ACLIKD_05350 [Azonexus sp. IMCC34842]|uniref:hypothetical protein n=1 Tax=Azonexus sp. IMCC34842 TaxID=3420950 RepID=UPI003D10E6D4
MTKEETTPRRQPVMRGAQEAGCCCWRPIIPPAVDTAPENPSSATDPLATPAAAGEMPTPSGDRH